MPPPPPQAHIHSRTRAYTCTHAHALARSHTCKHTFTQTDAHVRSHAHKHTRTPPPLLAARRPWRTAPPCTPSAASPLRMRPSSPALPPCRPPSARWPPRCAALPRTRCPRSGTCGVSVLMKSHAGHACVHAVEVGLPSFARPGSRFSPCFTHTHTFLQHTKQKDQGLLF